METPHATLSDHILKDNEIHSCRQETTASGRPEYPLSISNLIYPLVKLKKKKVWLLPNFPTSSFKLCPLLTRPNGSINFFYSLNKPNIFYLRILAPAVSFAWNGLPFNFHMTASFTLFKPQCKDHHLSEALDRLSHPY